METATEPLTVNGDLLALHRSELTLTQTIMLDLFKQGFKSPEVREALGIDRVFLSANVGKLRDKELIETRTNEQDRRSIDIVLTEKGQRALQEITG